MAEIDKKTDLIAVECCSSLNQMKKTLYVTYDRQNKQKAISELDQCSHHKFYLILTCNLDSNLMQFFKVHKRQELFRNAENGHSFFRHVNVWKMQILIYKYLKLLETDL